MEVEPEEVPSQIKDVLGMLVDYGALSGNAQKRPKRMLEAFVRQRQRGPAQGDELPCQLVLRRDRELNSLQRQNTYILFLSTGPDSQVPQLLQASAQCSQANQSLRQCLMLTLVQTLLQQAKKVKEQEGRCTFNLKLAEQTDPPGCLLAFSQVGSFQEGAGPGRQDTQYSNEMIQNLEQFYMMLERAEAIVRFHALQNRLKPHHQQQSKLAGELVKLTKKK